MGIYIVICDGCRLNFLQSLHGIQQSNNFLEPVGVAMKHKILKKNLIWFFARQLLSSKLGDFYWFSFLVLEGFGFVDVM